MTVNLQELEYRSAAHYLAKDLAGLFNDAFEGYVGGSFKLNAGTFHHFCASQNVNLALSQVVLAKTNLIGLALVARRGWSTRLATMGIIPEAKHKAVGTAFMEHLIRQAKARADHSYELEVIEQNPAGIKLYEKVGFKKLRRLLELSLESPQVQVGARLESIDITDATAFMAYHNPKDLPWQLSAFNLASMGEPHRAFKLKDAIVIMSDPKADSIRLHNLSVAKDKQRQGYGAALLQALFFAYPKKTWRIPALCPEESAVFFQKQGFNRGELSQLQMRLAL